MEAAWAFLLLPLLLPAPVQLSLAAGVACANGRSVRDDHHPSIWDPFPLLDTGAGAVTGCSMASGVSAIVLSVEVALAVTTLVEMEDDASSTDDWRALSTIVWVPLLKAFSPSDAVATSAVCATAPFALIVGESHVATGAILTRMCRRADITTPPFISSKVSLAAIHAFTVVGEEEEEEQQQPAPPNC